MSAEQDSIADVAGGAPSPGRFASSGNTLQIFVLVALGILLFSSNSHITFIDQEVDFISGAIQPLPRILGNIWSGTTGYDHPPLADLCQHFWLIATGGAFDWLRAPSILFYLLGLLALSLAAKRLAGDSAGRIVVWLGAVWPYGFHYGRMAGVSAVFFLLIAFVTLCYVRYVEQPTALRALTLLLLVVTLGWTSFFMWAVAGCIALDFIWRERRNARSPAPKLVVGLAVLVASYVPLWRGFWAALKTAPEFPHSAASLVLNAAFNVYVIFVSESVAPWYWKLGIPATLCVLACLAIVTLAAREAARKLWLGAFTLLALMAVCGILNPRRLLGVSAWLLLALSITLANMRRGLVRRILMASLGGILCVAWIGIFERTYYAAPRLIESWKQVTDEAATRGRFGNTIIGNNPPFFFYLTYALPAPEESGKWRFRGSLPEQVTYPNVYDAAEWLEKGRPLAPYIYFVRGAPDPNNQGPAWEAEEWLRARCVVENEQLILPDPAAQLKARFMPEFGGLPWRIRVLEMHCPAQR